MFYEDTIPYMYDNHWTCYVMLFELYDSVLFASGNVNIGYITYGNRASAKISIRGESMFERHMQHHRNLYAAAAFTIDPVRYACRAKARCRAFQTEQVSQYHDDEHVDDMRAYHSARGPPGLRQWQHLLHAGACAAARDEWSRQPQIDHHCRNGAWRARTGRSNSTSRSQRAQKRKICNHVVDITCAPLIQTVHHAMMPCTPHASRDRTAQKCNTVIRPMIISVAKVLLYRNRKDIEDRVSDELPGLRRQIANLSCCLPR